MSKYFFINNKKEEKENKGEVSLPKSYTLECSVCHRLFNVVISYEEMKQQEEKNFVDLECPGVYDEHIKCNGNDPKKRVFNKFKYELNYIPESRPNENLMKEYEEKLKEEVLESPSHKTSTDYSNVIEKIKNKEKRKV